MSLTPQESDYLEKKIGRKPNPLEFQIVAVNGQNIVPTNLQKNISEYFQKKENE